MPTFCSFRPEALHERDSYADPAEFAEGMETVLVAGVPVLEDGAITGAKPEKYSSDKQIAAFSTENAAILCNLTFFAH